MRAKILQSGSSPRRGSGRRAGRRFGHHPQRQRQLPDWPYNLFTMIHGKTKHDVLTELNNIVKSNGIENYACDVLISTETFKHQGARYDW